MSEDVQARIDAALRALGGYWSPLAGLARVLEELAELAAAETVDERRREAADCTVAVMALANQYCVQVMDAPAPPTLHGERQALISAGLLARLVNRFEGAKPPKPAEVGAPSLETIVGELFAGLAAAVEIPVSQLLDEAACTAEANSLRDARRFSPRIDTVTSDLRDAFARDVMGLPMIGPAIGLWGAVSDAKQSWRADAERFLRVDAVHPLTAFITTSLQEGSEEAEALRSLAAIPGLEDRVIMTSGQTARYLVIAGRRMRTPVS